MTTRVSGGQLISEAKGLMAVMVIRTSLPRLIRRPLCLCTPLEEFYGGGPVITFGYLEICIHFNHKTQLPEQRTEIDGGEIC